MTGLYVIFDRVAEESGPVFEAVNKGIAIRNFRNLLEKVPDYQRQDYRLYQVGEFDNIHMEVTTDSTQPIEVIQGDETNG